MADEVKEVVKGEGYAVANLEGIGEGYGFRKIRPTLEVTAFGINAIVIPAGYETPAHAHETQEETYFVHRGQVEMQFGDGSRHLLGPGGVARVDPATVRSIKNVGDEDAVFVVMGGKDGYVGRDGVRPPGAAAPEAPHPPGA